MTLQDFLSSVTKQDKLLVRVADKNKERLISFYAAGGKYLSSEISEVEIKELAITGTSTVNITLNKSFEEADEEDG